MRTDFEVLECNFYLNDKIILEEKHVRYFNINIAKFIVFLLNSYLIKKYDYHSHICKKYDSSTEFSNKLSLLNIEQSSSIWALIGTTVYIHINKFDKIHEWCKANCSGNFFIQYDRIEFEKETDLVLFKLLY